MTTEALPAVPVLDCWNRIGIAGDRSCPELERYVRCRNCPVFASAAAMFLEHPAPAGYLEEWARQLDAPISRPSTDDLSVLIFRLSEEWLAVRTRVVVEVTKPRPVHRIPHRSTDSLVGMVNLRGQLQLQVSLHGVVGVDPGSTEPGDPSAGKEADRRLVVLRRDGATWVFAADEVGEVYQFSRSALITVPSTLANPENSFSQSVIRWREKNVGLLDDQRVFIALKGLSR